MVVSSEDRQRRALTMLEVMAESVSLSPNLISCSQQQAEPSRKSEGGAGRRGSRPTHRDRDGVVFVDDGHDAHAEKFSEGVDCVQVASALEEL